MRGDERDGDFSAGQQHREVFHAAALGEEFGLSGELEARFVHARFVNRAGHDGIEFAAPRERDGFFQRGRSCARRFNGRVT